MDGFRGLSGHQYYSIFGACFEHMLPQPSKALLVLNVIPLGVMVITLFVMSRARTSTEECVKSVDISGRLAGVGFIIGLNGANWCLSEFLLPGCCHSTGRRNPLPNTNIIKSSIWTILITSRSGLLMVLAVLVNPGFVETSDYSRTAISYRIIDSKAAAIGLWIPVLFLVFASA